VQLEVVLQQWALLERRGEEAAQAEEGEGPAGNGATRAEDGKHVSQAGRQVWVVRSEAHGSLIATLHHVLVQSPGAGSSASGKRPTAPALGDAGKEGPRLSLVTALPASVWSEHLMPLLEVEEAVRLRGVCKAFKALVMEWPMDLCGYYEDVAAALRCFPVAESLTITFDEPLSPAEGSRMVELLRGHGGTLKDVKAHGEGARRLLSSAVRAGALPSLTYFCFRLEDPIHREILSGATLRLLKHVDVALRMDVEEQVAALEPLRRLPHLRRLWLSCRGALGQAFPAFIARSLKILVLDTDPVATVESLLRELPSILQASEAGLEWIIIEFHSELSAEGGAALGQVLRTCSSTLKSLRLTEKGGVLSPVCLGELVPGLMSCCATLEVLRCPWSIFSSLPATCPTFPRLTMLDLDLREGQLDCTSAAWDVTANGRLPALVTLDVGQIKGLVSGQGGGRLSRALEAVAGTLQQLLLSGSGWGDLPAGVCYELGVTVAKLRRLSLFYLNYFLMVGTTPHWAGGWLVRGASPSSPTCT
jgi:hypothetical protein